MKTLSTIIFIMVLHTATCQVTDTLTAPILLDTPKETYKGRPVKKNEFVGSFKWKIINLKNDKPVKNGTATLHYFFDHYLTAIRPDNISRSTTITTIIYDLYDKKVTTKVENSEKKMATIIKIAEVAPVQVDIEIKPTQDAEVIEGYTCKKYLVESETSFGEVWVAEELFNNFANTDHRIPFINGENSLPGLSVLKGLPMKGNYTIRESGQRVALTVSDMKVGDVNQDVFTLVGFEVMDMSNSWKK